ncbi:hypothetical protein [Hymenobacter mucosus]|uniref:Uncharacterized protein n=1 Tax=Hymenobacter mucosus TaxID=1411120 RepID=A0A239AAX7_9BACT|nr:hypothetical protein [Hymenobacter mucosus]SNR92174.1 hypothetical protein SAMN06269173_11181 [Hymenobacter mucosus]
MPINNELRDDTSAMLSYLQGEPPTPAPVAKTPADYLRQAMRNLGEEYVETPNGVLVSEAASAEAIRLAVADAKEVPGWN